MKARARANWGGRPWILNSSEHDGKGGKGVEQTEAGVSESSNSNSSFLCEKLGFKDFKTNAISY